MKTKKYGINWRAYTSLYMGYSLLLMTITGIVLYIAPPGRIAHWSNWVFLGFTKTEWQALHTIFSFLFVISGTFHVIFNWKPLINYMKEKAKAGSKIRKEFTYVTVTVIIFFFMTYLEIPPFSSFMDLGNYITDSWETPENTPPIPHAEILTVGEFSRTIHVNLAKMQSLLKSSGIDASDTSMTIEDLAKANNLQPNDIYNIIKGKTKTTVKTAFTPGSGFGRKKLSAIFQELNITWQEGTAKLKKANINVTEDAELKQIAEKNGISPIEIIKALGLNNK